MLSYTYITALYRSILKHSAAIQGRLYMAPYLGAELNSANLSQLVGDTVSGSIPKKYPLSLILAPPSDGDFASSNDWEGYTIAQLFLKRDGFDSDGNIQRPDPVHGKSSHTVEQDWADMRRVAIAFLKELYRVSTDPELGINKIFRIASRSPQRIVTLTGIGNDRLNGVMVTYRVAMFEDCSPADYSEDYLNDLELPDGDQHPEHSL